MLIVNKATLVEEGNKNAGMHENDTNKLWTTNIITFKR